MFYNAKNGNVRIGNTDMDYIAFGYGKKNLIMIPGLGDGLKTVKGTAGVIAMMYRAYARDYRVYMFSRKNQFEEGYSTRDMAKDQKEALDKLGICKADIIGISQGGMIAQYLAIDYPESVGKLILAVTLAEQTETIRKVIGSWLAMAEAGDYRSLMIDTAEKMYTENYLKKHRWLYPLLGSIGKPESFRRFVIMANACINHNAVQELYKIKASTFVIGADNDKVAGPNTSEEIANRVEGSKLHIFNGLGHGAYEEAKDFNRMVLDFLEKDD